MLSIFIDYGHCSFDCTKFRAYFMKNCFTKTHVLFPIDTWTLTKTSASVRGHFYLARKHNRKYHLLAFLFRLGFWANIFQHGILIVHRTKLFAFSKIFSTKICKMSFSLWLDAAIKTSDIKLKMTTFSHYRIQRKSIDSTSKRNCATEQPSVIFFTKFIKTTHFCTYFVCVFLPQV